MITVNYKLTSYSDYLHQLAAVLGTTVQDNILRLSPPTGSGFFQVIEAEYGPEAFLYDFTLNDTLVLKREQDSLEYYTLVFDRIMGERNFQIKIDADEGVDNVNRPSAFYLTSFLYDVESVLHKGVNIKGI